MEESKHACGITLSNGVELLIHVGIDTVSMNGDGFETFVKSGDKVKKGQPLIKFSKEKIKNAGYKDTTMLIITDNGNAENIELISGIPSKAGETVVAKF